MVKRTTPNGSPLFRNVLIQAEQRLSLGSQQATNFEHNGVRGNERAGFLSEFLLQHLPRAFGVGSGEARDCRDNVTGELDLYIYDHSTAAPIQTGKHSLIVPAEALYTVIEVKSVLSQHEIEICLAAAMKVRMLLPFKKRFIAAPTGGRAEKNRHRCPYYVFAYTSNLSAENWAEKEYKRVIDAAKHMGCPPDVIDRLIVLDRGIIRPQVGAALLKNDAPSLFLEFYIHLINFLTREKKRRPPIDWTAYTARSRWTKLT